MKVLKELIPYIIIVIVKNNQLLLLKKYDKKISRFDIVVIKVNGNKLVKRVIGLPGEHIEYKDNKLYVNGTYVKEDFIDTTTKDFDTVIFGNNSIPDNYYFVLGDNRNNSVDSRIIGLINKNEIIGTTNFSIFPFTRFGIVK